MNFADLAVQLCGQCALLFGWRPNEFWAATPAELACIARALTAQADVPHDRSDLEKLMQLFPDVAAGDH